VAHSLPVPVPGLSCSGVHFYFRTVQARVTLGVRGRAANLALRVRLRARRSTKLHLTCARRQAGKRRRDLWAEFVDAGVGRRGRTSSSWGVTRVRLRRAAVRSVGGPRRVGGALEVARRRGRPSKARWWNQRTAPNSAGGGGCGVWVAAGGRNVLHLGQDDLPLSMARARSSDPIRSSDGPRTTSEQAGRGHSRSSRYFCVWARLAGGRPTKPRQGRPPGLGLVRGPPEMGNGQGHGSTIGGIGRAIDFARSMLDAGGATGSWVVRAITRAPTIPTQRAVGVESCLLKARDHERGATVVKGRSSSNWRENGMQAEKRGHLVHGHHSQFGRLSRLATVCSSSELRRAGMDGSCRSQSPPEEVGGEPSGFRTVS